MMVVTMGITMDIDDFDHVGGDVIDDGDGC